MFFVKYITCLVLTRPVESATADSSGISHDTASSNTNIPAELLRHIVSYVPTAYLLPHLISGDDLELLIEDMRIKARLPDRAASVAFFIRFNSPEIIAAFGFQPLQEAFCSILGVGTNLSNHLYSIRATLPTSARDFLESRKALESRMDEHGRLSLRGQDPLDRSYRALGLLAGSNLRELTLVGIHVTDIGPLSTLTKLRFLGMQNTAVHDHSPLSTLTSLQRLHYRGPAKASPSQATPTMSNEAASGDTEDTRIRDITPIGTLAKLTWLSIRDLQVQDVTPLSSLINLRYLELRGTLVTDISGLSTLSKLENLHLQNTDVDDLEPLANLFSMCSVDLSGVCASREPLQALVNRGLIILD